MDPKIRERFIKTMVEELRSSSVRGSDADWYIGFNPDHETANESEVVGYYPTYLNQWDADNTGYIEEDDVQRDSGTFNNRLPLNMFKPYEQKKN